MPNYPDGGRFKPSCANFKINGNNHVIVAGGANLMINNEGTQRIVEVSKGKLISEGIFRKSEYPLFCHFGGESLRKFLLSYELCLKSFNFNKKHFEK